jgi:glycosyltransferase involved in cell wall biosynthesis
MQRPKITIVTPNFNQAGFLEETILSVIGQNYPDLEYIIVDGGSTDGSIDIIKKYEKQLAYWVTEPDKGLYHALQKGFERSTGEVMGWINSDDKLHPGSLSVIAEIFGSLGHVNWITGSPTCYDVNGRTVAAAAHRAWSKYDYYLYDYRWIQQESTFWRRNLWQKAGATLNLDLRYAADFDLWLRFFRHEKLYSVMTIIGGFRYRSGQQLSLLHADKYKNEVESLIGAEIAALPANVRQHLDKYKRYLKRMAALERANKVFRVFTLTPYFRRKLSDAPGFIEYDPASSRFHIPAEQEN